MLVAFWKGRWNALDVVLAFLNSIFQTVLVLDTKVGTFKIESFLS